MLLYVQTVQTIQKNVFPAPMASASFKSRLGNEVIAGKLYCHSNVYTPLSLNQDYFLEIEDVQ